MLSKDEINKGVAYIKKWVTNHSSPDSALVLSGSESWSPKQIQVEAEKRLETGDWPDDIITSIVESASKGEI